jgi:soluble lytic murein transglycosylase-like protein
MMMKFNLVISLALVAAAVPAQAEVIEIDSSGAFQRFDGPAVFTGDSVTAIIRETIVPAGASAVDRAIAEASRVHGVDRRLLEAVAWQESRGRMSAVSPKGAAGVMQLMPATAAELGVRRDDLRENIHGGAIYLRRQIDRFGSIPLALAAYNAGPGAVARYSGIPPFRETRDYVGRIMARWKPVAVAPGRIQAMAPSVSPSVIEVSN